MAAVVGSFAFLGGLGALTALARLDDDPQLRLFEINAFVSTAIVFTGLGTLLVVVSTSSLGKTASRPMTWQVPWLLLLLFPVAIGLGQLLAVNPEAAPWLFPFVNVAMVSIPSVFIAATVATRYRAVNPLAWPISWREWLSGFIYGAVGATTVAAIINTVYLFAVGNALIDSVGISLPTFETSLRTLPRGWGIFFDLSVLSIVAPINEEFWKGMLVAFFFFRGGRLARCFLWGVLAGAGFNLAETFNNSIGAVSPEALADETIGAQWWFFALARAGTAAMHAMATGFMAIGFYGLLRRRPRYLRGLLAGPLLHATWNFLVYAIWGDAILSGSGPDSTALDVVAGLALLAVFAASLMLLWTFSGRLRDDRPAPIYRVLTMCPSAISPAAAALPGHSSSLAASAHAPGRDMADWADAPVFHSVLNNVGRALTGNSRPVKHQSTVPVSRSASNTIARS